MVKFNNIEGWFNFQKLYTEMAVNTPNNGRIVELGVFKGKSAAYMCEEIERVNKKIHFDAIDWFKGSIEHVDMVGVFPENLDNDLREDWLYQHCLENLQPGIRAGLVNVIRMNVKNAVHLYEDESIDFCFHDASHEYDDLMVELPLWWNKIKPGGYFAGHDYGNWGFIGVSRAVNKFAEDRDLHVLYRAREDSWLIQKPQ